MLGHIKIFQKKYLFKDEQTTFQEMDGQKTPLHWTNDPLECQVNILLEKNKS